MIEHLGIGADGILQAALEIDAAFFRQLKPRLGLQNVDGNAGTALYSFILEIELILDVGFVEARHRDEAVLPKGVGVGVDSLEKYPLACPPECYH